VQATDAKGGFVRKVSGFPNWVTEDGAARPDWRSWVQGRGWAATPMSSDPPGASRTLIVRKLKGPSNQASRGAGTAALTNRKSASFRLRFRNRCVLHTGSPKTALLIARVDDLRHALGSRRALRARVLVLLLN
jgi:glutathionyl-hydroquinone reductase